MPQRQLKTSRPVRNKTLIEHRTSGDSEQQEQDTLTKVMNCLYSKIVKDNSKRDPIPSHGVVMQIQYRSSSKQTNKKNASPHFKNETKQSQSVEEPLLYNGEMQQEKVTIRFIPPTVPDSYWMAHTLNSPSLCSKIEEQRFLSLNYSETYWHTSTFELLAFADNFVHYVAKPKQELILGEFTLMDACLPISRKLVHQVLQTLANNSQLKVVELDAMFFREMDEKIVFLHHKMHFEGKYIRIQHFTNMKSSDEFIINGKLIEKSFQLDTTNVSPVNQYSKLLYKASRLMQTSSDVSR